MIRTRQGRRFAIVAVMTMVTAFGCDQLLSDAHATPEATTPATSRDERQERAVVAARDLSVAFQVVAEEVRPSVVRISTRRERSAAAGSSFPQSPFGDLFDRFFDAPRGPRPFFQEGLGSGFVISDEGYVVTNHHVIDGADEIRVHTHDERELEAELVGSDPRTDLAVLRIEGSDLGPVRFGASESLQVGEWVVAVGNPFGLTSTITAGIVSATGRSNLRLTDYEDFIQTDAAINPGNSGGPLVNLDGEVVGINTAIFSRSGGYMGIGFAIPADLARPVIDSLIEDGRVVRGWLGAWIQDLDEDLARSFDFDSKNGVLIGDVDPDGPSAAAGVESGDIVVSYAGRPVENADELRFAVAGTPPGSEVELEIWRDGRRRTIEVEIGELPEAEPAAAPASSRGLESSGMAVQTLTPELAARRGLERDARGALVTDVVPGGPAARAGVRPGDVVVAVGSRDVESAAELRDALARSDLQDGVRLTLLSGQARRFAFLQVR